MHTPSHVSLSPPKDRTDLLQRPGTAVARWLSAARPLTFVYTWFRWFVLFLLGATDSKLWRGRFSRSKQLFGPVDIGSDRIASVIFHYARLDPEDRFRRFNCQMRLPALVKRYTSIDKRPTEFFGFVAGGRIVGLVEMGSTRARIARDKKEVALSVLPGWQKRGIGEALLQEAISRVCRHDHKDLILVVAPENRKMAKLALKLGAEKIVTPDQTEFVFRKVKPLSVLKT